MIDSIHNIALNSIQNANIKANSYANNLSNFNADSDITRDIIGLHDASRDIKIGAKLLKTEQEMQNTILDIFA